MLFSKKSGFHCFVLYIKSEEPHPLQIIAPAEVASDVLSAFKKLEKSNLNDHRYLGNLGPFTFVQVIQGLTKIEIHNDTLSWSEPMLYTDFAKKVCDRLQSFVDDDSDDVEEDLIYFIGEFTMMQDNGFVAPF